MNIRHELNAEDFFRVSNGHFSKSGFTETFNQRGIYMIAHPSNLQQWLKSSAGGSFGGHWVSMKDNKILEPSTGTEYTVNDFKKWCRKMDYVIVIVVPFKEKK